MANAEQFASGFEIILKPLKSESTDNKKGLLGFISSKSVPTDVEKCLTYPRGGKLALIYGILMLLAQNLVLPVVGYGEESLILVAFAVAIFDIIYFFKMLKYTRKNSVGNLIVALILLCIPIVCYVYCIYLIFKGYECKKLCPNYKSIEKKIAADRADR